MSRIVLIILNLPILFSLLRQKSASAQIKQTFGVQFLSIYVNCESQYKDVVTKTLEQIDAIQNFVDAHPTYMQLITTINEINDTLTKEENAVILGIEGGHSIDSSLGVLRIYYSLGVRFLTLVRSCSTPWAGRFPGKNGLTPFGRSVILEINRLGMLIDLGQSSETVIRETIDLSFAPVVFSCSYFLASQAKQKVFLQKVFSLLKQSGGVVLMTYESNFLKPTTLETVVGQINSLVDFIGIENVGLGSNFDAPPSGSDDFSGVSKFPVLLQALSKSNKTRWTPTNLEMLTWQNLMNVYKNVDAVANGLKNEALARPLQKWITDEELQEVEEATKCRVTANRKHKYQKQTPKRPIQSNHKHKHKYLSF